MTTGTPLDVVETGAQLIGLGIGRGQRLGFGHARRHVRWHGFVHALRIRKPEPLHQRDELVAAARVAESGIAAALLRDGRHGAPLVVVRRVQARGGGKDQDPLPDGAIERVRIALLEVGAPAAPDQQRVAGERDALLVTDVGDTARGMTGRLQHLERVAAEADDVAGGDAPIRGEHARAGAHDDLAAESLAQQPGTGHVIRVDVGLERGDQAQFELGDQLRVATDLLAHGVDQHRLARGLVGEQIGVGGGLGIEELAEQHERFTPLPRALRSAAPGRLSRPRDARRVGAALRVCRACRLSTAARSEPFGG